MAKILTVDDEPPILGILAALLKLQEHEVIQFSDSAQAEEFIKSDAPFDLMVTDVRMTPLDGYQLLRTCRTVRPDTPVIMVSAYGTPRTRDEARAAGAYDFVAKPFSPVGLLNLIKEALEKAGAGA